jgi:hypothetical protein
MFASLLLDMCTECAKRTKSKTEYIRRKMQKLVLFYEEKYGFLPA